MVECNKCGLCCFPRKKVGDKLVIDLSDRCPFMNSDNTCSVFDDRFDLEKTNGRVCLKRERIKVNFPSCPFNVDGFDEV